MTTYYVVESGEIINAIEARTRADAERVLSSFEAAEYLALVEHPPMEMLGRYRYWNERP